MVSALGMAFEVIENLVNSDQLTPACCAHRQLHGPNKRQFASMGAMAAIAADAPAGRKSGAFAGSREVAAFAIPQTFSGLAKFTSVRADLRPASAPAPHTRQPGLLLPRQACQTVEVVQLIETSGRNQRAPCGPVVKRAVALTARSSC